jgi:hypothetical protein
MTGRTTPRDAAHGYLLRLEGHLDTHWYDWVPDLEISHETDGTTTLRGPGLDQAALHGLLKQVRDLGATLISITPLEAGAHDTDSHNQHHRSTSLPDATNDEAQPELESRHPHRPNRCTS